MNKLLMLKNSSGQLIMNIIADLSRKLEITEPIGGNDGALVTEFRRILDSVYGITFAVIGAVGVAWGLFIGIKYAMANGDEAKTKAAKESIKQFVLGIVIMTVIGAIWPLITQWILGYVG